MPRGEKTRSLWQNPLYRKHQSFVFMGRRHSAETKEKMSLSRRGSNNNFYGKTHSAETRAKISSALKGRRGWARGIKLSFGHRKKLSLALLGGKMSHSRNGSWKGEEAGYRAFHGWLRRNFGRAVRCDNFSCTQKSNTGKFHWALIHGKNHSHSRENYLMLCPSCHRLYDGPLSRKYKYRPFKITLVQPKKEESNESNTENQAGG